MCSLDGRKFIEHSTSVSGFDGRWIIQEVSSLGLLFAFVHIEN